MTDKRENVFYDQWLALILRRDVYRLTVDNESLSHAGDQVSAKYDDLLRDLTRTPVFIYSKVSTESPSAVRFLEERGFNLVDTNVIFDKLIAPTHHFEGHCAVRLAAPEDQSHVVDLARRSFVYSRFHLDRAFPSKVANMIRAEWVKSYFTGNRGNEMVVALAEGVIVGFLLLLHGSDGSLTIDLIAVDENHRRKGVAKDMIAYAESQCHGFAQIRVGTQLANIPSIRLYEAMGFKVATADYVFHYHNG